jgi:hypothetical protein
MMEEIRAKMAAEENQSPDVVRKRMQLTQKLRRKEVDGDSTKLFSHLVERWPKLCNKEMVRCSSQNIF